MSDGEIPNGHMHNLEVSNVRCPSCGQYNMCKTLSEDEKSTILRCPNCSVFSAMPDAWTFDQWVAFGARMKALRLKLMELELEADRQFFKSDKACQYLRKALENFELARSTLDNRVCYEFRDAQTLQPTKVFYGQE